jgi:iron complex transport system ATP-binding protein
VTLLSVSDLSIQIDNKSLLDSVSFTVSEGDYLCVLGQNGAGKSTLLKSLMGITSINSGRIILDDHPFQQLSQRQLARTVSYVGQRPPVIDMLVSDFIRLGRYPYHDAFAVWSNKDQTAFDSAVILTGIEAFLERHCATLSGGEFQRVQIAAALCQQATLLLLDEPTSSLDPHHQVEVHALVQQLNQEHRITIIEVTHDLNHAVQHSQHILALKAGKTLWYGDSSALLTAPILSQLYDHPFVTLTHPETNQLIALSSETQQ